MSSITDSTGDSNKEGRVIDGSVDFGAVLASARKFKNHTVEHISEQLKIPVRTIIALEKNDISALPAPTFTQGYIRAYTKYLEISAEDVLVIYNRAVPHELAADLKPRSNLPEEASSQSLAMKTVTMLLIVAGIMAIIYGGFQYYQEKADVMETELESKRPSFTGNSLDSPSTSRLTIKQNARLTDDDELIVASPAVTEEADTDMTITDEREEDSFAFEAVAAQQSEVVPLDVLKISAVKGSWIQVRDASHARLFYNMVPEGGVKILRGQAPFSITLGNAATTHVIINGLKIDMFEHIRENNTATFNVSTDQQKIVFH
jgi:cytoskeleton protein RodZ